MRWLPTTLRMRLTLWYATALTVILVLYAAGVYAFVQHNLYVELDRQVNEDFEAAEASLRVGNIQQWLDGNHHEHEQEGTASWGSVWDGEGKLLYHRVPVDRLALPAVSTPPVRRSEPATIPLTDGEMVRQVVGPYVVEERPVVIAVARSENRVRHGLNELLLILLVGLPIAVGLAGFGGWFLAGRALHPVKRMAAEARTISAERLSKRLPVAAKDELGSLATVFNETLARLEKSFGEMRRFTADASHELRTPLTAMRSVGEVGLKESRDEPAYRAIIGSMLEEVDRMSRLVEGLLTLARADGTGVRLNTERVDLEDLAREVATYLEALAEEKGQRIVVESAGEVPVEVDRTVFRQALVNLVDNAIKYGPRGSSVLIRVSEPAPSDAILEVVDSGPGIPDEHRQQVFERFYRVDESRARELGGAGLGLAIARWAVEIHGGRIELETEPGKGSLFRIILTRRTP